MRNGKTNQSTMKKWYFSFVLKEWSESPESNIYVYIIIQELMYETICWSAFNIHLINVQIQPNLEVEWMCITFRISAYSDRFRHIIMWRNFNGVGI